MVREEVEYMFRALAVLTAAFEPPEGDISAYRDLLSQEFAREDGPGHLALGFIGLDLAILHTAARKGVDVLELLREVALSLSGHPESDEQPA